MQITTDIKKQRHENLNLKSKYEAVTLWIQMFSKMNESIRNFVFDSQNDTARQLS